MYRPKDWKVTRDSLIGVGANNQSQKERYFEAGADAILEGLKKGGIGYVDGCSKEALESFSHSIRTMGKLKGHLVFIPEEG